MNELRKKIIQYYVNSYNNFDIEGMTKHLDDNIVFENMFNGNVDLRTEGLQEFKKQAESAKKYFSQRNQAVESWVFDDEKISVHINYSGVLAIDLPNGLKKGETLKLKGISEFEFENEKIKRIVDKS